MKAQEFFELTGKVRAAQKQYFKSRLQGDLIKCKQLESELDKALKEGIEPDEPTAPVQKEYQARFDFSAEPNPENLYNILNTGGGI